MTALVNKLRLVSIERFVDLPGDVGAVRWGQWVVSFIHRFSTEVHGLTRGVYMMTRDVFIIVVVSPAFKNGTNYETHEVHPITGWLKKGEIVGCFPISY